jgi:hypothetical protein
MEQDMTKEALKLALEALNTTESDCGSRAWEREQEAITAIKEALANEALDKMAENARELGLDYEPAQEPVAFINVEQRKLEWAKYMSWDTPTVVNLPKIPLYTIPPQRTWVGLTDEEKKSFWTADQMTQEEWDKLFNAIETKLKEKNT